MSPRHSFEVILIVGRTLARKIDADDASQAMAIAEYLYANFGDQYFRAEAEEIVDFECSTDDRVAS